VKQDSCESFAARGVRLHTPFLKDEAPQAGRSVALGLRCRY